MRNALRHRRNSQALSARSCPPYRKQLPCFSGRSRMKQEGYEGEWGQYIFAEWINWHFRVTVLLRKQIFYHKHHNRITTQFFCNFSSSPRFSYDHIEHVRLVLERLNDANLKINLARCEFARIRLVFSLSPGCLNFAAILVQISWRLQWKLGDDQIPSFIWHRSEKVPRHKRDVPIRWVLREFYLLIASF